MWDDVDEAAAATAAGEPVRVIGSFAEHPRYGRQITVHSLLAPAEIDWERLLDAPAIPIAELERRLDEHIADVRDPHLAALMESLLGTQVEQWPRVSPRVRCPVQPPRVPRRSARALAPGG